jgi:hypothetical protein
LYADVAVMCPTHLGETKALDAEELLGVGQGNARVLESTLTGLHLRGTRARTDDVSNKNWDRQA